MNDLIDIIIVLDDLPTEENVRKVATILNQDIHRIRMLLFSRVPRVVAQYADSQIADDILDKINALGLCAFKYPDPDLQKPLSIFRVKTLEFTGNNLIFKDKIGQSLSWEMSSIFLIIQGILRTSREKEVLTNVKTLNVTATLLTGGIPIRKTVQERKVETTSQSEAFIRLFTNNSPDICPEIRQYGFNYSCLGAEMSPSSQQNFNLLANKIKISCPRSVYDLKLSEYHFVNTSTLSMRDNIDVLSKLIFFYYRIRENRK
jgi:hypothetical protein